MSNQITECTIKSRYISKVQNGRLNFIPKFAMFVQKRELLCISTLFIKELGYNQPTSEQSQAVCEFVWVKDIASCFSQGWGQKWGSLLLLSLVTDASMVRKRCQLLEVKATQPIEQQAGNRSDNCILGNNYSFARHTFVARNSNQTTRFFPPGGMDGWARARLVEIYIQKYVTLWLHGSISDY